MPSDRAREVFSFIGANVWRVRTRVGMTQEKLAEAVDLDLRFVQRVERGQANPSVEVIVRIADELMVPPGSLFRKARLPAVRRGRPPGKGRRP